MSSSNSKALVPAANGRTRSRIISDEPQQVESRVKAAEDRTDRIAKWICRGLFLLAALSWLAALLGSLGSPVAFAGTLTAGAASLFGMVVTNLYFGDDE